MTRNITSRLMGDPPPGRSAQDQLADATYDRTVQRYPNIMARLRESESAQTSEPAGSLPTTPVVNPAPSPRASETATEPSLSDPEPDISFAAGTGLSTQLQPPGSDEEAAPPPAAAIPLPPTPPEGTLRSVEPILITFEGEHGIEPPPTGRPIFEEIDPRSLLIEDAYQRGLSEQSMKLIERIATGWDWRKFRPPVVVFADAGIVVVDGQHTSIAAASRPDIDTIPCQVIEAPDLAERAKAFVGQNADRLGMSPMQLHKARVAAHDEDALTIEQVCARAGVTLVHNAFGKRPWKPGETVAISAIASLIQRRHAAGARQILEVLAKAECAPVSAAGIKAAEFLLHEPEFADEIESHEALAAAVAVMGDGALIEAKKYAADHCVPLWRGLASAWFRKTRKRRKPA